MSHHRKHRHHHTHPVSEGGKPARVAVVAGLRTPFVRSGGDFKDLSAVDLGAIVVNELVARSGLPAAEFDALIFGQVIPSQLSSLIGREVVLRTGLPRTLPAHTTSRACATSLQAATEGADQILLGHADTVIAGGAESLSDAPIFASHKLAQALVAASRARSVPEKLKAFAGLSLRDVAPVPPALKEPTTGLTMGESAQKMAWENGITREAQDRFAQESHRKASDAWASGKFAEEVMAVEVPPRFQKVAATDNNVRADTTVAALAALKPVFDKRYGTITAGNSSPLTDGAAAVILMSEGRARELGVKPLGYLRAYAYAATDPGDQLLQGPAYAAPVALDRAGLRLQDMDVVEMHEAFAAQVLSNLQAFAS
ncbi:MAG TPA: acetyl-CoA C-acyltransferase, partial [Anaeromyxobacteraceae bacterium]|nr:acetyl-CoA C-acyltransferase [Anaeromyxobacteraceae bacterium]